MTKFNLISDCHLNFGDLELPGGDVLIMAGDILEAGHLRLADNSKKDVFMADRYRRFLNDELKKYSHVIYVCGNHEHYGNVYDDTFVRLRKELPAHAHLLEAESFQIDDVHIFAGTLWTNFHRANPMTIQVVEGAMNDFHVIKVDGDSAKVSTGYGGHYYTNRFTAQLALKIFNDTVGKLKAFCAEHEDDKVLVVTHHSPSELSVADMYKDDHHMNGAYYSRLEELILDRPCIKTWVHGHMHTFNDYKIGECRVISNPRGYIGYEVIANSFKPFEFEL